VKSTEFDEAIAAQQSRAARVNLPAVSDSVSNAIRSLVAGLAGEDRWDCHDAARRHEALPLYADLGGILFLRPDGEVLVGQGVPGEVLEVETNRAWHITVRVIAAEQYPDLRPLLPARPPGAVLCEVCGGSGKAVVASTDVTCGQCFGLGWEC